MFTKVTRYNDYLGGEGTTGFSPALEVWSQMPPETASEVENLKIFPRGHAPRPPS